MYLLMNDRMERRKRKSIVVYKIDYTIISMKYSYEMELIVKRSYGAN